MTRASQSHAFPTEGMAAGCGSGREVALPSRGGTRSSIPLTSESIRWVETSGPRSGRRAPSPCLGRRGVTSRADRDAGSRTGSTLAENRVWWTDAPLRALSRSSPSESDGVAMLAVIPRCTASILGRGAPDSGWWSCRSDLTNCFFPRGHLQRFDYRRQMRQDAEKGAQFRGGDHRLPPWVDRWTIVFPQQISPGARRGVPSGSTAAGFQARPRTCSTSAHPLCLAPRERLRAEGGRARLASAETPGSSRLPALEPRPESSDVSRGPHALDSAAGSRTSCSSR